MNHYSKVSSWPRIILHNEYCLLSTQNRRDKKEREQEIQTCCFLLFKVRWIFFLQIKVISTFDLIFEITSLLHKKYKFTIENVDINK